MSMVGGADGVSQGVFSSKKERATLRCSIQGACVQLLLYVLVCIHLRFGSPVLRHQAFWRRLLHNMVYVFNTRVGVL